MRTVQPGQRVVALAALSALAVVPAAAADPPSQLNPWLGEQHWRRDTPGPLLSLGTPGSFDDTHIFAPCVAQVDGCYLLWYSGSQGTVAQRVFRMGLATSGDGRGFERHGPGPVYGFGDGRHSVLTPTLLRNRDGTVLREVGLLRCWFSVTHFASPSGLHTLHETTSRDGVRWSKPSPALMEHVYAPSVIRDGDVYRMWYTDVSRSPWTIGHAHSRDGRSWERADGPVLTVDQPWEQARLFYPTVLQADGVYLMWYGSYWSQHANKTAIGLAASLDGSHWVKNPHNPVLAPDPNRPWESHYTTSQSVLRLADGSFRIWYASRKAPPFVNKYFAINTARWPGP